MFSHVCFLLWLRIAQQGSRTRSWVYFWGTSWNGEGEEPTYIQNDDDDEEEEEPEAVSRHPLLSAAHPHEGAALFYSVHSVLMLCFVVVHEQRSQTAME